MFNFSGVLYRIWGVCGVILVLGVACILLNRPWARKVKIKDCKLGLIMIAAAIGLSLLYPDVSFRFLRRFFARFCFVLR